MSSANPSTECPCDHCEWLRNRALRQARQGETMYGLSETSREFLEWARRKTIAQRPTSLGSPRSQHTDESFANAQKIQEGRDA